MKSPIQNPVLLRQYMECIKAFHTCAANGLVDCAVRADEKRQAIHNQILAFAGTTRDDKEFATKLSMFVEEMLEVEEDIRRELFKAS